MCSRDKRSLFVATPQRISDRTFRSSRKVSRCSARRPPPHAGWSTEKSPSLSRVETCAVWFSGYICTFSRTCSVLFWSLKVRGQPFQKRDVLSRSVLQDTYQTRFAKLPRKQKPASWISCSCILHNNQMENESAHFKMRHVLVKVQKKIGFCLGRDRTKLNSSS